VNPEVAPFGVDSSSVIPAQAGIQVRTVAMGGSTELDSRLRGKSFLPMAGMTVLRLVGATAPLIVEDKRRSRRLLKNK
jgi:hypothetical protein